MFRWMKEDAAAAKRDFEDGHRLVAQRLADAGFASTDELTAGIAAAAEGAQARHGEAAAAEAAVRIAERSHLAGEASESGFKAAEAAERRRLGLEQNRAGIDALQALLTRAQKAERAMDLASRLTDLDASLRLAVAAETDARTSAREAEVEHGRCEEAVRVERRRAERIDALLTRAADVERQKGLLAGATDLKAKQSLGRKKLDEAQTTFDAANAERIRLDALCSRLAEGIEKARSANLKRAELSMRLATATADHAAADAHGRADRKLALAKNALALAEEARDAAAGRVEPLRAAAVVAERSFIDAQAQVLAGMHLIEGEACPVCGSPDHPSPAHGDGDPRTFETEMRSARKLLDDAVREADRTHATVTSAGTLLVEREAELAALIRPKSSVAQAASTVAGVEAEIEKLGGVVLPAELEAQIVVAAYERIYGGRMMRWMDRP
ncbi:hypothetical protein [Sphingomonas sp. PP-CC-3G-468]|uniref:hypothetical protein n=1 Tax=Sphingomonas sp. PP-CC-3G-468 TaxID=2135656 RepID=UPI001052FC5D|nr:hypothetical protein [Sphingomonas sp. PP-CC-3G-468]TCM07363.1 hypothetical protein C8J41_103271 [Sphingomonas sp. PP-CC-3G-468]